MLKLMLQYFGHLMWRADSLEKNLILGKMESKRRSGQQRMRWLNSITDSVDMKFLQTPGERLGQGCLECCNSWDPKELDMTYQLNNSYKCHTSLMWHLAILLFIHKMKWVFASWLASGESIEMHTKHTLWDLNPSPASVRWCDTTG